MYCGQIKSEEIVLHIHINVSSQCLFQHLSKFIYIRFSLYSPSFFVTFSSCPLNYCAHILLTYGA